MAAKDYEFYPAALTGQVYLNDSVKITEVVET